MNVPLRILFLALAAQPVACLAQAPPAQPLKCTIPTLSNTPADQAFTAGDSARAESLFTAQLTAAPTPPNYAGLVRAQLDQNKLLEALASANRAVTALPNSADAQALLGDALARSGQIPEASAAYVKGIGLDRCSASAHFGFARLNDLVGRHLTAAKEINFAHRLSPVDPFITSAFLDTVPVAQRLPPLRAFLATHPALPPAQLDRLATKLAILDQHLACTPEIPYTAERLELTRVFQNGRYVRGWGLKPRINDASMPIFELDSSVNGIVLNPDDAAKARVHPLTTAPISPNVIYQAVADEIKVGGLTFRGCPVTVVPANVVDNRNSLIGTSFFRDHLIHIDYVAMTLTLTPLPEPPTSSAGLNDQFVAPEEKDWSPVYVAGPNLLLPTLINKKGPYLFALDTGIGHSVLSPSVNEKELSSSKDVTLNLQGYAGAIVKVIPRDGGGPGITQVTDVRGPDGALLPITRPVKLPVYRFTTNEFPDDSAVAFDLSPLSHADGIEVSGLFGFHILSYFSLDLNYRDCLARVLFDPNRRYHVNQSQLAF